jgi:catechol 2,3-dioxygenase-like lactoylglutathione lyase family enzyme
MSRFHHMGITVSDIEASYRFYSEVVGMRVWDQEAELGTHNPNRKESASQTSEVTFVLSQSEAFDQLTDNPGSALKYVNLVMPNGFVLQLIEYLEAGGAALELDHNRPGSPHLSIFVADAQAKFDEIQKRPDVEAVSPVVAIQPQMHSFYVRDPDGLPVEFLQVVH